MELSVFYTIFKEQGIAGAILAFLVFDRFIKPAWKKNFSKSYVSWGSISKDLENIKSETEKINGSFKDHVAEDDRHYVEIARLKQDYESHKESEKAENGHIFNQLKSIFDKLDSMDRDIKDILKR